MSQTTITRKGEQAALPSPQQPPDGSAPSLTPFAYHPKRALPPTRRKARNNGGTDETLEEVFGIVAAADYLGITVSRLRRLLSHPEYEPFARILRHQTRVGRRTAVVFPLSSMPQLKRALEAMDETASRLPPEITDDVEPLIPPLSDKTSPENSSEMADSTEIIEPIAEDTDPENRTTDAVAAHIAPIRYRWKRRSRGRRDRRSLLWSFVTFFGAAAVILSSSSPKYYLKQVSFDPPRWKLIPRPGVFVRPYPAAVASSTETVAPPIREVTKTEETPEQAAIRHFDASAKMYQEGQIESAVAELKKATQANPRFARAYSGLGMLYGTTGRLTEAVTEFRTALRLDPNDAGTHINLGVTLERLGKMDESINEFRTAIRLGAGGVEAHFNLGVILQGQGKLDDAVIEYGKAINLQPGFAEAHNNLGNIFLTRGQVREATEAFQKAVMTRPTVAKFHHNLSLALRRQGQTVKADAAEQEYLRLSGGGEVGNTSNTSSSFGKATSAINGIGPVVNGL